MSRSPIRYWQRRPSRRPLPSVHRWPFAPRDRRPCDSGISCRRPVLLRRDDGTHFPQATATCSLPIGTKEALQNRRIVRGLRLLAGRLQAENLQDAVALRQATFEDVAPDEGPFGVVVAAQSFHWTDPETRWSRLAVLHRGRRRGATNLAEADPSLIDVGSAAREFTWASTPTQLPRVDGSRSTSTPQAADLGERSRPPRDGRAPPGQRHLRTLGAVAPVVAVRRALAAVTCLSREARAG